MSEVTVSKSVFFIGAWRTQAVTDNLIRQISSQILSKKQKEKQKGYTTTLTLTSGGLELLIQNQSGKPTRTDKIPLENIIDFIGNKYSSTCILAIVKDKQKLTVFVFLCSSERDAGDMVQSFGIIKKRLSGEGYNLNLTPKGTNWIIKTKGNEEADNVNIVNNTAVEHVETIVINGDNTESRVGEVRVLANGDLQHGVADSISHESSNAEFKDELVHITDEVKAIKIMLEEQKPDGANDSAQYGYRVVTEKPSHTYVTTQNEHREVTQAPSQAYETRQNEYRVVTQKPSQAYETTQNEYRVVTQNPSQAYETTQNEYRVVTQKQPQTYETTQNEYRIVTQKPSHAYQTTHHEYKVATEPQYQNTGGSNVVYHYETMANNPSFKTQNIYTKNQKYTTGAYVMRGRTNTSQSKQSSVVSLPYSMKSEYSRRRYDSPNPFLDKTVTLKNAHTKNSASMRVLTTATPKGVYRRHASHRTYSGDKIVKHIEDVYKHRNLRRHLTVPMLVNPKSVEYVQSSEVSPTSKQMKVVVSPPPMVHATSMHQEGIKENFELQRQTENSNGYGIRYETVGVQHGGNTDGRVFTSLDDNTDVQVINSGLTEERIVMHEANQGNVSSEDGVEVQGGGDVIVIKAQTLNGEFIQPAGTTTTVIDGSEAGRHVVVNETHSTTYVNQEVMNGDDKVIHIKAETAGPVHYVRDYKQVEVIDTRDDEDRRNESDNEDESNRNSAQVIIREEHIKPPVVVTESLELAGDYDGEVRRVTKNDKRVHYMEELNRNMEERRESDMDVKVTVNDETGIVNDNDNENNNDDKEIDAEIRYILDEERLKEYTKEPDIVIIEQDVTVKSSGQGIITENDLQRGENTVLF